jgi:DNA-binding GntR family transcriptional regulator
MGASAFRNAGVEIAPLSKDTLQERVYRHVREMILDGSIVPGEMVTVQSLADAFGVSPMPVREALRRLTAANALTVVSGRSVGIPALSLERLTDLRNVRYEIEAIAGGWAAANRDDDDLPTLARYLEAMQETNASGEVKGYLRANYGFHFTIYRAAKSENLLRIIEDLWLQISPYFNMLHESGNYSTANTHHEVMYNALRDRDAEAMRAAIQADVDGAYHVLLKLFR